MKTIGIIGGLSPESTVLYYTNIVREYRGMRGDENYPKIIIYSVCFGEFTRLVEQQRFREAAEILVEAAVSLHSAGADFALISANTPHMFFEEVKSRSPIPLISIIDALAEELKRNGVRRVGLLGTKHTLTHPFYADGLRKNNIEAIIPDPGDVELVNEIIYDELVKGVVRDESRGLVVGIIRKLVRRGAEGIALACTELPLLITGEVEGVKLYDTAKIHSMKALELALRE